jgi:hypothetical protein
VHQAKIFGRCEPTNGIAPFGRLVEQVMRPQLVRHKLVSKGRHARDHARPAQRSETPS